MIFLIHYDRKKAALLELRTYGDECRQQAEQDRLKLEIGLLGATGEHEVVLLEAESEQAIRQTHRRYFESLERLIEMHGQDR